VLLVFGAGAGPAVDDFAKQINRGHVADGFDFDYHGAVPFKRDIGQQDHTAILIFGGHHGPIRPRVFAPAAVDEHALRPSQAPVFQAQTFSLGHQGLDARVVPFHIDHAIGGVERFAAHVSWPP